MKKENKKMLEENIIFTIRILSITLISLFLMATVSAGCYDEPKQNITGLPQGYTIQNIPAYCGRPEPYWRICNGQNICFTTKYPTRDIMRLRFSYVMFYLPDDHPYKQLYKAFELPFVKIFLKWYPTK